MTEKPHLGMLFTHVATLRDPTMKPGIIMLLGPKPGSPNLWLGIILQGDHWWGRDGSHRLDITFDPENSLWQPYEKE